MHLLIDFIQFSISNISFTIFLFFKFRFPIFFINLIYLYLYFTHLIHFYLYNNTGVFIPTENIKNVLCAFFVHSAVKHTNIDNEVKSKCHTNRKNICKLQWNISNKENIRSKKTWVCTSIW